MAFAALDIGKYCKVLTSTPIFSAVQASSSYSINKAPELMAVPALGDGTEKICPKFYNLLPHFLKKRDSFLPDEDSALLPCMSLHVLNLRLIFLTGNQITSFSPLSRYSKLQVQDA